MCEASVYDLTVCAPHVPAGARYRPAEFALYREGYDHALTMVLRTLRAAVQRYELRERTRRLTAKRRRLENP